MHPWIYEASKIQYDYDLINHLYVNKSIRNFLDVGFHDHNFFIVAPKGVGKTLLLSYKSYKYRNSEQLKNYIFYPETQLVEGLDLSLQSFSKDDLLNFSELSLWENIWNFVLYILIHNLYSIPIPPNITLKFAIPSNPSPSSILGMLLSERRRIFEIIKLNNELLGNLRQVTNGMAIFIDSADQALEYFLTEYHHTDEDNIELNPSVKVWINAQMGLLLSAYHINNFNKHIKIFVSVRSEAYTNAKFSTKQNLENYCTYLEYTKFEIEQIFIKNIDMMDTEDLIKPKSNDGIERFLGFKSISHLFARDENDRPRIEPIFDFLLRHTFGRPREIVRLGNELFYNLIQNSNYKKWTIEKKMDRVREAINDLGHEFFEKYTSDIIPQFNYSVFYAFLTKLNSNVLTKSQLDSIGDGFINSLYRYGILGCVIPEPASESDKLIQRFLPAAKYNYELQIKIPESSTFFVMHPTTDKSLISQIGIKFYNKENIIGYDKEFFPTSSTFTNEKITLHFGPGKLGLGLVVPLLIDQRSNVAIFHSPTSKTWQNTLEHLKANQEDRIILSNKNQKNIEFKVFYDNESFTVEELENLFKKGLNLWFFSTNESLLTNLLKCSRAITTSIRTIEALNNVISKLKKFGPEQNINVYPFENDRNLLSLLEQKLGHMNYTIVPLTCDKICTQLKFSNEMVYSDCENPQRVYIFKKNHSVFELFGRNPNVVLREKPEVEAFDYQVKSILVNSIHSILALRCEHALKTSSIKRSRSLNIVNLLSETPAIRNVIDNFIELEIIRILVETDKDILYYALETKDYKVMFNKLLKEGNHAKNRFANKPDNIKRILGLKKELKNKYNKRIKPLSDFLTNEQNLAKIKKLKLLKSKDVELYKSRFLTFMSDLVSSTIF